MDWRKFLLVSTEYLSLNPCPVWRAWSWCSYTTFRRLGQDAGYWTAPLPKKIELLDDYVADGSDWGSPLNYNELAHIIIPRIFEWETISGDRYDSGIHEQDIVGLSARLMDASIDHRVSDLVLEVKRY